MGLPPYIVDLNTDVHTHFSDEEDRLAYTAIMQYYSDTRNIDYTDYNGWIKLTGYKKGYNGSQDNLYVFLNPVEWKLYDSKFTFSNNDAMVREVQGRDVDPKTQSGYPATIFGMDAPNAENSSSSSFISVIQLSNNVPIYTPIPLISYADNDYQREVQAWSYQISDNAIDVIAKRGKVTGPSDSNFNNDVTFIVPQANNANLKLPGGQDYGFSRLVREGNLWVVDPDFQINLQQKGYFYGTNTTINTKSYPTNTDIYVGDNTTLTVSGTMTLQSGTTVHLGVGAVIHTTGSGNIQATGTMFKTLSGSNDASQRYKYVRLDGSGSQFTQCTFQGGSDGVLMASSGNQFNRCTFEYCLVGFRGMYSGEGSIIGSVFVNNHYGIDLSQTSVVYIDAYQNGSTFTPTSILSNSSYGLYIYDNAMAVLHYSRVDNNSYGARTLNYGRLYAGDVDWSGSDQGWNRFTSNTNYAIYNTSLAADGSTWTDEARDNWWGTTSPPSGYFYGSVDYGNPLTYDPTVNGATSKAAPSNMEVMGNNGGTNEILTTSKKPSSSPSNAKQHASERLTNIYAQLSKQPDAPGNYRLLQKAYELIQLYDQADTSGFFSRLDSYGDQFHTTMVLASNPLNTGGKLQSSQTSKSLVPSKAMKRMGATAVLLKIDHLLRQGKWKEIQTLADRFDPYIRQKDDRSALLASRAVAWENQKQFGKAFAAYKQIESIQPDPEMADHYVAPDYSLEETALKDSMKAYSQTEEVVASSKSGEQSKETLDQSQKLPREFSLGDNYPNPFNPTTTIPINLPKESHVEVVVYNIAGQRVATLADREYQAGSYQLRFDAHQLASGVYFIRARLGEKTFIKRMTLIK